MLIAINGTSIASLSCAAQVTSLVFFTIRSMYLNVRNRSVKWPHSILSNMYRVTVQLSEEKLAAIRALFADCEWDWDPEVEEVPATTSEATLDSVPNPIIPPQPSSVECPDCLCRPWVIAEDNRQSWWPDQPKSASRTWQKRFVQEILVDDLSPWSLE